jgi:2-polyprenyl-6-methoxyphenol hydroxylase-like FAD-dependent oxidoreductase
MGHKQPVLEKHLRLAMDPAYSDLRVESTIVSISEDEEFVHIEYTDATGQARKARAKFFVAADGKTGFTRKKYLEPRGVIMEKSPS